MKYIFLILSLLSLQLVFAQDYLQGQLFVRTKANNSLPLGKIQASPLYPKEIQALISAYKITEITAPFRTLNPQKLKGKELILALHQTFVIYFEKVAETDKLIADLQQNPDVILVEKVPLMAHFYTPNDPQFASQWNLAKIQADLAWNIGQGNTQVRLAIVDDAVLTMHQDLSPNIWTNPNEVAGDGIDNDLNGYIDDTNGWDAADNDNNPIPPAASASNSVFTHGTHCAGIAAAKTDNATGIASISCKVKIIPVKCNNDTTPGPSLPAAYAGLTYAISVLPHVISLSWGGPGYSAINQSLLDLAYANNITVIAAAGNSNSSSQMYPAAYNHVISVAASDQNDLKASFSNFGPTIDVTAPGVDILSSLAGSSSSYGNLSGTSMACPLTAGLAALMLSMNPTLSPDDVEDCLKNTADDIYPLNAGYIGALGAGRINAFQAMQCISGPPIANFSADATQICTGSTVQFTDNSFMNPTTWSWTFAGGTPATSTAQNPSVVYNTAGNYVATLIVSSALGSDTMTMPIVVANSFTATISGGGIVNPGSPADLQFDFAGTAPWDFVYTDGTTNFTVNGITSSPYFITVNALVTTTYTLVSATSQNGTCPMTLAGTGFVSVSSGCGVPVHFQNVFGGNSQEFPTTVIQTLDCGYLIGGYTYSYGQGAADIFLCKLNSNGFLTWFNTYGDFWSNVINDIIQVSNGYVVTGAYEPTQAAGVAFSKALIMKIDFTGNQLWARQNMWLTTNDEWANGLNILETPQGDLIMAGVASRVWHTGGWAVVKADGATGNMIWNQIYGSGNISNHASATDILPTNNGYLVVGQTLNDGLGVYDILVSEVDTAGNLLWAKVYGGAQTEYAYAVAGTAGGFVIAGQTASFGAGLADALVFKIDSTGNVLWSKTYGGGAEDRALEIVNDCNGGFYVAGSTYSFGNGIRDLMLLHLDNMGDTLQSYAIGGVLIDGTQMGLDATGDCGFVLTGSTQSFGAGQDDALVVKDSLGYLPCPGIFISPIINSPNILSQPVAHSAINENTQGALTPITQAHNPFVQRNICSGGCTTPIADFDYSSNLQTILLLDNAIGAEEYHWEFGDGGIDSVASPIHAYLATGTYNVMQVVINPCGRDTFIRQITLINDSLCHHVIQPGPVKGKDAVVFSRSDAVNDNNGLGPVIYAVTWTWAGVPGSMRTELAFDLSSICDTATLLNGALSMFYDSLDNSVLQAGTNQSWLVPNAAAWDEYTVTWNNKPATSAPNTIAVPQVTGTNDLINLPVTPLIQQFITGPNYGFQMLSQNESPYVAMKYGSSDHPKPLKRPKLDMTFYPIYAYGGTDKYICEGDSTQLNIAGYHNPTQNAGPSHAIEYKWYPSTGLSCIDCPNPTAFPDTTTTYIAAVISCAHCAALDTFIVHVEKPSINAAATQISCTDLYQLNAGAGAVSYAWTPALGLNNANIQNPLASVSQTITYTVTSTYASGCVATDTVQLIPAPVPLFPPTINDTLICATTGNVQVALLPQNYSPIADYGYQWALNGTPLTPLGDPNVTATLNGAIGGVYDYILTITTFEGCVFEDTVTVTVSQGANPAFTNTIACVGKTVTFTDQSTGTVSNLIWKFGTFGSATGSPVTFTFPQTGIIPVTLYVGPVGGICRDSLTKNIPVGAIPVANFTATDFCIGDSIHFTDNSTLTNSATGDVLNLWNWSFGDLGAANTQNTAHLYGTVGNFSVTHIVQSQIGCADTISQNISIKPLPTAMFTNIQACENEAFTFNNTSTALAPATLQSYAWNFGDSGTSAQFQPVHAYSTGIYTVSLTVTSSDNCSDNITQALTIYPKPTPDFSVQGICEGDTTLFLNLSNIDTSEISTQIANYSWSFGDGTSSNNINESHVFSTENNYLVQLTATSSKGCSASIEKQVLIRPIPAANPLGDTVCLGQNANLFVLTNPGNYIAWYNTNTGGTILSQNPLFQTPPILAPQTWYVQVKDNFCKTAFLPVSATTFPETPVQIVVLDSVIEIPNAIVSFTTNPTNVSNCVWDFGDKTTSQSCNPVHEYLYPHRYVVHLEATNEYDCPVQAYKNIEVKFVSSLFVPSAFSPNGENNNDYFYVGHYNIGAFHIAIYDRWGTRIYESNDLDFKWDGKYKSQPVPEGVYIYKVAAQNILGEPVEKAGSITVIR